MPWLNQHRQSTLAAMNTEMKDAHLAAIIKCERKRRNLTQEYLAQLAEVDVRIIQRIERTGSCSAETLMAIAEAFEIDSKELIAEAEQRATAEKTSKELRAKSEAKSIVVRLEEITNGPDLFNRLSGAHAGIEDVPAEIGIEQEELVGLILDDLRDFGDIQQELNPSDRLRLFTLLCSH
jgi:transcriptional regulator with XRE-family HTH domain